MKNKMDIVWGLIIGLFTILIYYIAFSFLGDL